MQSFLDRPQSVLALRRLHQDKAAWIKAQRAYAVAVQPAVTAMPVSRDDEEERTNGGKTGQQRHHKTKGGGDILVGHNFMQSAAGKTALRQIMVDGRKAEGDRRGLPNPFHLRQ